ncbi:uncharacterized protein LOC111709971 [Eurytemora carolleeae]|uniref:uncharacterized protein LOC111709971 n=1 Tax=Eurytemora carolleeae TaxID=1294199 RepID=UPI000C75E221|nr:uncharacterized protein LOC111709971 [Eurytemora carolleeae]|eukprot:XP_023339722.1 uncharacterized protein LOC111709971 [Eurytemora affinis]
MVARPRAMDGSADLRWRYMQSGQDSNLKVPQGRMLSGFPVAKTSGDTSFTSRKHDNSIHYNYALSKDVVSVPVYHYNGGPHVTTTILSQCWRLTYLHCDQETEHPCCALAVAEQTKQYNSLSTSVLDKWLVRS